MKFECRDGGYIHTGVKLAGSSAAMSFSGYASTFNGVDSYGDTIQRGAFAEAVRDSNRGLWPAMLLQHGGMISGALDGTPIGIWTRLEEDAVGLRVTGTLADTTIGRDLWTLLTMHPRAAITGLSIGFAVIHADTNGLPAGAKRRITKVRLAEVSVVTFPANRDATITSIGAPAAHVSRAEAASDRLLEALSKIESASKLAPPHQPAHELSRLTAFFQK